MNFTFQPLTTKNWKDFELLFGPNGACAGCWCMTWRLHAVDFNMMRGEGNRKAMKALVKKSSPGILAYAEKKPAGWCAVSPREEYLRLENSKVLRPVDDKPVWSVSCFYIAKEFRRRGLSVQLLKEAVDFAFKKGATIVEGYPYETKNKKQTDVFVWTGLAPAFLKAGFREVARRSETRPIMRIQKKLK
jgi:GNAT superfamily N-acetyltransferase